MTLVYLIWSLLLLGIWGIVYAIRPALRRRMWLASLCTAPLGLSEPLFVPEYWLPPTLFDLAAYTGFDIESLLFSFAVGGIGSVLYPALSRVQAVRMQPHEVSHPRHRWHRYLLSTPFVVFIGLEVFTSLNPIYSASLAMFAGAVATGSCRPDLWRPMLLGGVLFTALYFVYFSSLVVVYPDYVRQVWQLHRLSGWMLAGVPVEELLFAVSLGLMWSALYEHVTWQRYERHDS